MAPSIVHLPNGQTLTVSPSFGGLYFKSNELNTHHNVFPPGWTIILHSEDEPEDHEPPAASSAAHSQLHPDHAQRAEDHIPVLGASKEQHIHRFKRPTLKNDHLFISSISNPSSHEFRPPTSPTRQIAMMLWATLWWYFHQPEPSPQLTTGASANTPDAGKPKGEWRININREGIFKSKHLLPKLERMGLIATEDSAVGLDTEDGVGRNGEGWNHMFVSRRAFWQLDPRIYLFTIAPAGGAPSPYPSMSPSGSRPASPNRAAGSSLAMATRHVGGDETPGTPSLGSTSGGSFLWRASTPPGPFSSGSHLPTFYPPAPAQYKWTGNVRHPIRPKFPRQGETFYTRYVPSLGQYLSFRVASLSPKPILHRGPVSLPSPEHPANNTNKPLPAAMTNLSVSDDNHPVPTTSLSDVELLNKWMNDPRVAYSWGETGPISHQQEFLANNLQSGHSFPVIGSFDGKPFGYLEIYYVKEDKLAAHMGGRDVGDWDRGLHVLVGEQEFRGSHRVKVWLSALVHYCWTADLRTERVVMEPRVDNEKLKSYCEQVGFWKEKEVSFPHKQSNLMKIRRDSWEQPAL